MTLRARPTPPSSRSSSRPRCAARKHERSDTPLLEIKGLHTSFYTRDGLVRAVDGIDFHVDRGEIMGLVGESGCGKSVTSLSIMRLVARPGRIVSGEILFDGQDLLKLSDDDMRKIRGDRISMIFQQPTSSLNPVWDVGRQIEEVLRDPSRDEGQGRPQSAAGAAQDGRHPRPRATPAGTSRTRCPGAWPSA